ncbi:MAG: c-type cytochrome [Anaerolineales bacterium]
MSHHKAAILIWMLLAIVLLTACGGSGNTAEEGTGSGKEAFNQTTLENAAGCKTCHSLEPGTTIIGPSLAGIGSVAGSRVEGLTAEEYIRQSITDPNAYIVEGYPASVMPNVYDDRLTAEQIDQLVSFMLSLEGDSG